MYLIRKTKRHVPAVSNTVVVTATLRMPHCSMSKTFGHCIFTTVDIERFIVNNPILTSVIRFICVDQMIINVF